MWVASDRIFNITLHFKILRHKKENKFLIFPRLVGSILFMVCHTNSIICLLKQRMDIKKLKCDGVSNACKIELNVWSSLTIFLRVCINTFPFLFSGISQSCILRPQGYYFLLKTEPYLVYSFICEHKKS